MTCSRKRNCCNKLVVFVLFLKSANRFSIIGFAVLFIQSLIVFVAPCHLVLETRGFQISFSSLNTNSGRMEFGEKLIVKLYYY